MGQAAAKAREAKGKPKTGRKVNEQKIQMAKNTGVLSLKESKLSSIPPAVFELDKLKTLDLSYNNLKEIPIQIANMKSLKTLNLRKNQLTGLPDLSTLSNLTTLVLDENQLKSIGNLPSSLTKISLSSNQFRQFPLNIGSLVKVEHIDLSNNILEDINGAFCKKLVELREIQLDNNRLTYIPSELSECQNLKTLSLRQNSIASKDAFGHQSFPVEFLQGSNISVLNLRGNPLSKQELLDMEGFNFFLERRKEVKDKELHGGLKIDTSICELD